MVAGGWFGVILDAILSVLAAVVGWVASLFPSAAPPAWFVNLSDTFQGLLNQFGTMGTWMPTNLAVLVFGAWIACVGIGFAIKLVRIIVSFVTVGGGSAG